MTMAEQPMTMRREDLSPLGKKFFELVEFDEDERLIAEIRKHPFGLFLVYFTGFFISALLLAVTILAVALLGRETAQEAAFARPWVLGAGLILVLLALLMTFIGVILYKSNVVFITSEKIAQVLYISIFNRKISQLSLGDIQDVTVKQNGILPRIFDYGTVVIETAGEQNNYIFTFTPTPYQNAKKIVGAHESNLKLYGN